MMKVNIMTLEVIEVVYLYCSYLSLQLLIHIVIGEMEGYIVPVVDFVPPTCRA
jgi:hypothetical protein